MFTYFTELFSLNSSKTTECMVIKLCIRQSYQNCEVDSKVNGENPMRLRHTVTKIFAKNHSVKLVNALQIQSHWQHYHQTKGIKKEKFCWYGICNESVMARLDNDMTMTFVIRQRALRKKNFVGMGFVMKVLWQDLTMT